MILRTVCVVVAACCLLPGAAIAQELSCGWRAIAQGASDNTAVDPGPPWYPGERLTDPVWRALSAHFEQYHHGLWTAAEVDALEASAGVQLAVVQPLPDGVDDDGLPEASNEVGVVQWPERVSPRGVFLVAIGSAEPGEDWILRAVGTVDDSGVGPALEGPASATVTPAHEGFYRVHRVQGAGPMGGSRALFRAERVAVNPLGLHSDLRLTTDSVRLPLDESGGSSFNIVASGSYMVRTVGYASLPAPVVVNLSLEGPGAGLFALQTLPASGEPAVATTRNVRVSGRVDFRVLASPGAVVGSALLDQVLPAGQALELTLHAEIVSFANPAGLDLDGGLATAGFTVAPGVSVFFPPARQIPPEIAHRRLPIEVWRADVAASE
jgi:hypothetical protein